MTQPVVTESIGQPCIDRFSETIRAATRLHASRIRWIQCDACEVRWRGDATEACWMCGQPGGRAYGP